MITTRSTPCSKSKVAVEEGDEATGEVGGAERATEWGGEDESSVPPVRSGDRAFFVLAFTVDRQ